MAKLKKTQLKQINNFLMEKNLFDVINTYLSENNLSTFEVESLKLKPNTKNTLKRDGANLECELGYKKAWVCTTSGKCEWRCVPIK